MQKKDHKQPWYTQPKGGKGKGDRKSAFTSTASTYVKTEPDEPQFKKRKNPKGKGKDDKGASTRAHK